MEKSSSQLVKSFNKDLNKGNRGGNTIMICAAVFMIIPILNLIFGWIGLKKTYSNHNTAYKKHRIICTTAFFTGAVELVGGVIAVIALLINGNLGVTFSSNVKISLIINFTIFGVVVIGS